MPNRITWVHSLLKKQGVLPKEWELTQCLFGEHLLKKYPDKPVCLVEAEKTALICAALMPKCVWVSVGGKVQLGDKVEVLYGRTILAFPDSDAREKWIEKINERPYLNIHRFQTSWRSTPRRRNLQAVPTSPMSSSAGFSSARAPSHHRHRSLPQRTSMPTTR